MRIIQTRDWVSLRHPIATDRTACPASAPSLPKLHPPWFQCSTPPWFQCSTLEPRLPLRGDWTETVQTRFYLTPIAADRTVSPTSITKIWSSRGFSFSSTMTKTSGTPSQSGVVPPTYQVRFSPSGEWIIYQVSVPGLVKP